MLRTGIVQQEINSKNIKAIQQLYVAANIRIGGTLTSQNPISKVLKQGCCIAPTLFKIYLNEAVTLWRRKRWNMGLPSEDKRMYMLHFSDDQAMRAEDESDLDYMLRKLEEKYKLGLSSNRKKLVQLVVSDKSEDNQPRYNGQDGLNWYGYLQRPPNERWPKKIWKWAPASRRRCRPRQSWREDV